jgi:hypothetical protein
MQAMIFDENPPLLEDVLERIARLQTAINSATAADG